MREDNLAGSVYARIGTVGIPTTHEIREFENHCLACP
jgi:hypothetical protein